MFRCLLAASTAITLSLAVPTLVAQDSDRERTETLSRRAADRLQSLHDEADRLATDERTLLGDVRRLELDREIKTTELEQARERVRKASEELASLDQQVTSMRSASVT